MGALIFWGAVFACIWTFGDRMPFQSELTVYRAFCKDGLVKGKCATPEETSGVTTYKALVDQQTIVYWNEDGGAPRKLWNCAVRDAKNWGCNYGNKIENIPSYDLEMMDGELSGKSPLDALFYQVPKWRWWNIWLQQKLHS